MAASSRTARRAAAAVLEVVGDVVNYWAVAVTGSLAYIGDVLVECPDAHPSDPPAEENRS